MKLQPERVAHRFVPGALVGILACALVLVAYQALDQQKGDEPPQKGDEPPRLAQPRGSCAAISGFRQLELGRDVESEAPIPAIENAIAVRCDWDLYLIDADEGEIIQITDDPAPEEAPRWSPDGRRLAFMSSGYRENGTDIFVLDADGVVTNVSELPHDESNPSWSSDGTKIAFTSYRDTIYRSQIYVMNSDGSNLRRLTESAHDHDYRPVWSPDGSKLAFFRYLGGSVKDSEIFVINADGSGEQRLTENGVFDADPAWSPDGSRIAFHSERDGNKEIYVMDANGLNPVRLTEGGWPDFQPDWSPDGSKIVFVSLRTYAPDIFIMNADGTNQTNLTNGAAGSPGYCCPAWRPRR